MLTSVGRKLGKTLKICIVNNSNVGNVVHMNNHSTYNGISDNANF